MENKEIQLNDHVCLIMPDGSRQLSEHEYSNYDLKDRKLFNIGLNFWPRRWNQISNDDGGKGQIDIKTIANIERIILDDFPSGTYQLSFNGKIVQTLQTLHNNTFYLKYGISTMMNAFIDACHTEKNYVNTQRIDSVCIVYRDIDPCWFSEPRYITLITNDGKTIQELVKPNSTNNPLQGGIIPYLVYEFNLGSISKVHVKLDGEIVYSGDIGNTNRFICVFDYGDKNNVDEFIDLVNKNDIKYIDVRGDRSLNIIFEPNYKTQIVHDYLEIVDNRIKKSFGIPCRFGYEETKGTYYVES